MQGARWVGGNELDLSPLAAADRAVRERRPLLDDAVDLALHEVLRQAQVDEAGRSNAGRVDDLAGLQVGRDRLGDGQRRHHRRARQAQRKGAGVVAVRRVSGSLDEFVGQGHIRQAPRLDGRPCSPRDERPHTGLEGRGFSHRQSLSPQAKPGESLSVSGRVVAIVAAPTRRAQSSGAIFPGCSSRFALFQALCNSARRSDAHSTTSPWARGGRLPRSTARLEIPTTISSPP